MFLVKNQSQKLELADNRYRLQPVQDIILEQGQHLSSGAEENACRPFLTLRIELRFHWPTLEYY